MAFGKSHCNTFLIKDKAYLSFLPSNSLKAGKYRNAINYVSQMLISNILIKLQSNAKQIQE